jgi:hypothetical protein
MSSEQALSYNGPLSTYREWDSLVYGIAVGCLLAIPRVRRDIRREPSKAIGGVLVTVALTKLVWR